MNKDPVFKTARREALWWMVNSEFESELEKLGLGQHEIVEDWIDHGRAAPRSVTGRGRTQLLELPESKKKLILRRTLHGGALAPLWRGYLAGTQRLRRELEVTSTLLQAGAAVPCPVLGVAIASGPLWRASLATVHIPNTCTGLEWLMSGPREPERTRRCAQAVGEALGRFHACGGQHADLHAGNILLREGDGDARAWIIDLDKARCNMFPVTPRHNELNRLARSLEKRGVLDSIDHSTREIFIEAYKTALKTGPQSVTD